MEEIEKSEDRKTQIMTVIEKYLITMSFKDLCQKLLFLLSDSEVLTFVYHLTSGPQRTNESIVLCDYKWNNIDDLTLYNSLVSYGKQVISLIVTDEGKTFKEEVEEYIKVRTSLWSKNEIGLKSLEPFFNYAATFRSPQYHKLTILEAFLQLYQLTKLFLTKDSVEFILINENIKYEQVTVPTQYERKKSSKRRRHSEIIDTEFIGWKLENYNKKEESDIYATSDMPTYLFHSFLHNLITKTQ